MEKPWLNCTLHLLTWTDKQWSGVCQDPSCPELESQVIAKFLMHGVLPSARLLRIKENTLLNPPLVQQDIGGLALPLLSYLTDQATLARAERWVSSHASSLQSIFAPKGCLEKLKHTSEFPLWARPKVTRDPMLGRCLCEVPACKVPKNADGNCYFQYKELRTISLALESQVPRAMPAPGPKDEGT